MKWWRSTGDFFGDAVNSAARLAELVGGGQILTTQSVPAALLPIQRSAPRSMWSMYLRGHAVASHVYRIEWQTGRDEEATTAERSMFAAAQTSFLELSYAGLLVRLDATSEPISPGQATKFALPLNDHRVSWMHAMSAWRSGQFVITDASTYGTWLYVGSQSDPWSCVASSAVWPAGHKWCLALAGPTRPHPG